MELAITILIISVIALIVGIYHLRKSNYFLRHGIAVKATIVGNIYKVRESDEGADEGLYYPVVRFLTEKQAAITKELDNGYLPKKKEGTMLEVIYDPSDPTKVVESSIFQLETFPITMITVSICGLIFSLLVIWYTATNP